MASSVKKKSRAKIDVVRCNGDLNASTMVQFKNKVTRLMDKNHKNVLLDLENVEHVDLAGLGILVERIKKIRSVDGDIKLCNMRPKVNRTFQLVGVSKLIESYSSKEEALRSFCLA